MEVGKHCSEGTCKRLDFLPFTCSLCQLIFWWEQCFCRQNPSLSSFHIPIYSKDHCSPEQHSCIRVKAGHSPREVKNECDGERGGASRISHTHKCSATGCNRREQIEVSCPHCNSNYCLAHRHPEDHNCSSLPSSSNPKTTQSKALPRFSKVGGAKGGAKSESLAAKVALMRIKQRAEGMQSVPQSERLYYNVVLPSGARVQSAPLFFSKEWTVGKVVDSISRKFNIRNQNDLSSCSKKLVLYASDGTVLNSSASLGDCLHIAPSGGSLRLDYEYS